MSLCTAEYARHTTALLFIACVFFLFVYSMT